MKHSLENGGNKLLRRILSREIENKETLWAKQTLKYLDKLSITVEQILTMKVTDIKNVINEWDCAMWREGMENKKSLKLYMENKFQPSEEKWIRNGYRYAIMSRARADSESWMERIR